MEEVLGLASRLSIVESIFGHYETWKAIVPGSDETIIDWASSPDNLKELIVQKEVWKGIHQRLQDVQDFIENRLAQGQVLDLILEEQRELF